MAWLPAAILGGTGLVSGLLDDSGDDAKDVARIQAAKAYPGQKTIAKSLAPYLWENLDVGLTEQEKTLYRSGGKTNILRGAKGAKKTVSAALASQGLKGGSIADIISRIDESTIPSFGKLETDIMGLDIAKKNKRMSDILDFLNLKAGEGEPANGGGGTGGSSGIGFPSGDRSPEDVQGRSGSSYEGDASSGEGSTPAYASTYNGIPSISEIISDIVGGESDVNVSSSGVSYGGGNDFTGNEGYWG